MYLHILRELGQDDHGNRQVALYHRNTSEHRKQEILADLQLALDSPEKKLLCVVATVSLGIYRGISHSFVTSVYFQGVGVDIRVHHAVVFGLSENAESLLQEGGRPMRGSSLETKNQQGLAFFFHKGNLGKIASLSSLYC